MLDPTPPFTQVVRQWEIYNYHEVQRCLRKTQREFGRPGQGRWSFEVDVDVDLRCQAYFRFRDPHDAMIFALKYLE